MAKGIRICKICGEPYECCHTNAPAGVNRWQDVACCIEHATEYFRRIAISRGELIEEESEPTAVEEESNEEVVSDWQSNECFSEDFEEIEDDYQYDSEDEE